MNPVLRAAGFIALGLGIGFLVRLLWPTAAHKKQ
jgi:preprotein translocase subunit Sss1